MGEQAGAQRGEWEAPSGQLRRVHASSSPHAARRALRRTRRAAMARRVSAGAVYVYFPGKEEIVRAIAFEAITEITAQLGPLVDAPGAPTPLYDVIATAVMNLERLDIERGIPRIAVQVWGEAICSPALADDVREIVQSVAPLLTRLVERHRDHGSLPADIPVHATARALLGLIPGFIVQRVLTGLDAATYLEGLRVLLPAGIPVSMLDGS